MNCVTCRQSPGCPLDSPGSPEPTSAPPLVLAKWQGRLLVVAAAGQGGCGAEGLGAGRPVGFLLCGPLPPPPGVCSLSPSLV